MPQAGLKADFVQFDGKTVKACFADLDAQRKAKDAMAGIEVPPGEVDFEFNIPDVPSFGTGGLVVPGLQHARLGAECDPAGERLVLLLVGLGVGGGGRNRDFECSSGAKGLDRDRR